MDPYTWQEMTSLVKSILENKNLSKKVCWLFLKLADKCLNKFIILKSNCFVFFTYYKISMKYLKKEIKAKKR